MKNCPFGYFLNLLPSFIHARTVCDYYQIFVFSIVDAMIQRSSQAWPRVWCNSCFYAIPPLLKHFVCVLPLYYPTFCALRSKIRLNLARIYFSIDYLTDVFWFHGSFTQYAHIFNCCFIVFVRKPMAVTPLWVCHTYYPWNFIHLSQIPNNVASTFNHSLNL